jgi:hypothetical protein
MRPCSARGEMDFASRSTSREAGHRPPPCPAPGIVPPSPHCCERSPTRSVTLYGRSPNEVTLGERLSPGISRSCYDFRPYFFGRRSLEQWWSDAQSKRFVVRYLFLVIPCPGVVSFRGRGCLATRYTRCGSKLHASRGRDRTTRRTRPAQTGTDPCWALRRR